MPYFGGYLPFVHTSNLLKIDGYGYDAHGGQITNFPEQRTITEAWVKLSLRCIELLRKWGMKASDA